MAYLLFIIVGILLGAGLIGAYLLGHERGRLKAIDEMARTFGGQVLGGGRMLGGGNEQGGARPEAEMALVGETEANSDGEPRQAIIGKLAVGEDVELKRDRSEAHGVRVVSRLGEIGRLAPDDAQNIAAYLDSGGRVSASIAHITAAGNHAALNVVINVVGLQGN
jgi:hypothetical protein